MKTLNEERSYWPVISLVILIFFGLLNLFVLLFYAPRIHATYEDIFPGAALPRMTLMMLMARFPLVFVILAWSSAAVVRVKQRHPSAIYIVGSGLFAFLVFLAIMAYALVYLPANAVANGDMGEPYVP